MHGRTVPDGPAVTPIRVAHLITKMAVGGAQESALTTCVDLDRRTFTQVLISGAEVDSEGTLFGDPRAQAIELVVEDAVVRRVDPWRDLFAVVQLTRRFRRWKPDIVHTHSSKAGLVGRLAARAGGVPHVVHSVHGWSFNDDMSRVGRQVVVLAERVAAKLTDVLIVESSTDLPKGLSRGIGRARQYALIRNGIDLSQFIGVAPDLDVARSLGVEIGAPLVGTVGRLAEQKHPLLMVDAFAEVARRVPTAEFVWVGDGPLRAETEARIAAQGLVGRFHIVGVRRDVPAVLACFRVFALSSRWEGLPRTITEAMATGVPVVATQVDGTAEVIAHDENGLLVPSGDADALADGIAALLLDEARAARLAAAASQRAEVFSKETMSADMATLYRNLVDRGRALPMRRPRRVVHVITGLEFGGAERQLEGLILASDPRQVVHEVVTLTGLGPIGKSLVRQGVSVTPFCLSKASSVPRALLAFRRHLARSGADVVQTWLYHGDLVGGLVARSAGLPVVWNVRMTWMDAATTKRTTMAAATWGARLSGHVPSRIVFNSAEGLASHRRKGYRVERGVVLENGIDLRAFRPDPGARRSLLGLLGVSADEGSGTQIIGAVARADQQKGHDVLLDAFRVLASSESQAHLVLVGRGCAPTDASMVELARRTGVANRIHLLGPRSDVAALTPAFDIAVSASTHGESYSNAVVEALACAVPVLATDVGAAREIIGDAGRVVAAGVADELARGMADVLADLDQARRSALAARERLAERSFERLVERYLDLYEDVLDS